MTDPITPERVTPAKPSDVLREYLNAVSDASLGDYGEADRD